MPKQHGCPTEVNSVGQTAHVLSGEGKNHPFVLAVYKQGGVLSREPEASQSRRTVPKIFLSVIRRLEKSPRPQNHEAALSPLPRIREQLLIEGRTCWQSCSDGSPQSWAL